MQCSKWAQFSWVEFVRCERAFKPQSVTHASTKRTWNCWTMDRSDSCCLNTDMDWCNACRLLSATTTSQSQTLLLLPTTTPPLLLLPLLLPLLLLLLPLLLLLLLLLLPLLHCVSKKLCQCYFSNNSMKHWPIQIIFGMEYHEETWSRWLRFCPAHSDTVATLPCEMQKS